MEQFIFDRNGNQVAVIPGTDLQEYAATIGGTVVEMIDKRPEGDLWEPMPNGLWHIPDEVLIGLARERELTWQGTEMQVIANQLLAIEEEADDALSGDRKAWLAYRTKVRLWHESPDFPEQEKRPVRPS